MVKNLPAMWETWVRSLDWEDPLKKGMTTHSSILTWRIPWNCIVHGVAKSRTRLNDFHFHCSKGRERGAIQSPGGYTHLTQERKYLGRIQVQIDSW